LSTLRSIAKEDGSPANSQGVFLTGDERMVGRRLPGDKSPCRKAVTSRRSSQRREKDEGSAVDSSRINTTD